MLAPQLGFVLHSIDQYSPGDRQEARQIFGLDRNVGVMTVVASTPAQKGGLMADDELLAINGRRLSVGRESDIPTRALVDIAQAALLQAMRQGPVTLRVSGATGEREVRFTGGLGCPSNVELVPGDAVNAWADGSRIMLSEGLLRYCATDGDLALILAHEMAHNLLHHRHRLAVKGILLDGLLPLTTAGSRAMRQTEEEADRLAVALAAAAAYDLSDAESFMSRLLNHARPVFPTHPSRDRRLALLRSAIAIAQRDRAPVATVKG